MNAGSRMWLQAVEREQARGDAEIGGGVAAPGRRQPAQHHREHHDEHQADPERRQAEADDRASHDRPRRKALGLQAGIEPEGDADRHRNDQCRQRQLQGCRHAIDDHTQGRLTEDERSPEIAAQRAAQEVEVLLPHRPVEPQRPDRLLDVLLVHLRVDQQPHGIADDVDAEEDDHRHDGDQRQALQQPSQDVGRHACRPLFARRTPLADVTSPTRAWRACIHPSAPCI